jgi:hypothetical protein
VGLAEEDNLEALRNIVVVVVAAVAVAVVVDVAKNRPRDQMRKLVEKGKTFCPVFVPPPSHTDTHAEDDNYFSCRFLLLS